VGRDADFGPFLITFSSYFPYNAKLCLNGNEWAKCQAAKADIAFVPLDDGFASCEDPARLQRICARLGDKKIDALAARITACCAPASRRSATRSPSTPRYVVTSTSSKP
jgi:hypothetical protein